MSSLVSSCAGFPAPCKARCRSGLFRRHLLLCRSAAVLLGLSLFPMAASAQWSADPAVNTPVVMKATPQVRNWSVSDGGAGTILAWNGVASDGSSPGVYAQYIGSGGHLRWPAQGLRVNPPNETGQLMRLVPDQAGGAIVLWNRDSRLFAQRLDSRGSALWSSQGIPISSPWGRCDHAQAVADGAGGALIFFKDTLPPDEGSPYRGQHISASGQLLWGEKTTLPSLPDGGSYWEIAPDGHQGALFLGGTSRKRWVVRIASDGVSPWRETTTSTVALPSLVVSASAPTGLTTFSPDGFGGALVIWAADDRFGSHIYAQRVTPQGTIAWDPNGVRVTTVPGNEYFPAVVPDGTGGGIVTWGDFTFGSSSSGFRAQRLNPAGGSLWPAGGVGLFDGEIPFTDSISFQPDQHGGIIVAAALGYNYATKVTAQRISPDGNQLWGVGGAIVSTRPGYAVFPSLSVNADGGAAICWLHRPPEGSGDSGIYAAALAPDGRLRPVPASPPISSFFSAVQTVSVESNSGSGYQLLHYNYVTRGLNVSDYFNSPGRVPVPRPGGQWDGSFLYDYDSGRFTRAVYSFRDRL